MSLLTCWSLQLTILLILLTICHCQHFINHYAVHIVGGHDVAKRLAEKHGFRYVNRIMDDYYLFEHERVSKRSLEPDSYYYSALGEEPEVKWIEQQTAKRRVKRDLHSMFNDPMWPQQWYLNRGLGLDMNVAPAYKWGMTGKDVVVSILDDGIEKDHPDLVRNYDSEASYDVNGHDDDPQPRYDMSNENRHGTRCAGEVAADANNKICNVGIAYDAHIGGVRMLDGEVTDAVEAQSLALNRQHIDIYSASWGPDDDGRTVDGPGPLARKAFSDGIVSGRRGLGNIFVWASGNGGSFGDNCNCDGYTNSIYTLSISSASESGLVPWYSEACSSTLATTYSSGGGGERQICTTDLHHLCTDKHTGTSASAPLAAGVVALALQANPQLTWRDMQHVVVLTAQPVNLRADDWVTNGAGRNVSHHFGFGMMDAGAMVELAMEWRTVPEHRHCEVPGELPERTVPINGFVEVDVTTDGCHGDVKYIEQVEAVVTLSASVRGQVSIYLTSPAGTRSMLLSMRNLDRTTDGFNAWPFMTTHCWGESPSGVWKLEVRNGNSVVTLKNWTLIIHGTRDDPQPPLTGQRRRLNPGDVSCLESEYLLAPYCYTACPRLFYAANETSPLLRWNDSVAIPPVVPVCLRCHPTCAHCFGPDDNHCINCSMYRRLTEWHECIEVIRDVDSWAPWVVLAIVVPTAVIMIVPCVLWLLVIRRQRQLAASINAAGIDADIEKTVPLLGATVELDED